MESCAEGVDNCVDDMLLTCERLIPASVVSSLSKTLDLFAQGCFTDALAVASNEIDDEFSNDVAAVDEEFALADEDAFDLVPWPFCFEGSSI